MTPPGGRPAPMMMPPPPAMFGPGTDFFGRQVNGSGPGGSPHTNGMDLFGMPAPAGMMGTIGPYSFHRTVHYCVQMYLCYCVYLVFFVVYCEQTLVYGKTQRIWHSITSERMMCSCVNRWPRYRPGNDTS
jgi:hypothetical protein